VEQVNLRNKAACAELTPYYFPPLKCLILCLGFQRDGLNRFGVGMGAVFGLFVFRALRISIFQLRSDLGYFTIILETTNYISRLITWLGLAKVETHQQNPALPE
jgi:hypothetical protein